jgi:hypothetical protein
MSVLAQDHDISRIEQKAKLKYLSDNSKQEFRYADDATIEENEIIDGNIIVVRGDLIVFGKIIGDVLIIDGDARVKDNAEITGNITSVNGHIFQDKNSFINGNQIETHAKNLLSYEEREENNYNYDYNYNFDYDDEDWEWSWSRKHYGSYSTLPINNDDESLILRYNRVQGLFLGLGVPKWIGGKYNYMTLHGFAGYGFKEEKWRYQLGLDRWLFDQRDYRFEIGGKIYDLTDSRDEWLVSTMENSLSSLLLKNDYHDFYRKTGYEVHLSQNYTIYLKGTVSYRNDEYESLINNANWSLLNKDKKFKENPLIADGNMRSLYGELYLDTRDNKNLPRNGWYGLLAMETSNNNLKSDFSFNQYSMELRRYQPFGYRERLDIRIKIGSAEGELPIQKAFQIGGLSTLRAFRFKEFFGDRMLLANLEYNLNPKVFSTDFLFFDRLNYVVFYDIGNAWNSNPDKDDNWYEGFDQVKLNRLKSDIGAAILFNDGHFRLSISKRLDSAKHPPLFTVRIVKPF